MLNQLLRLLATGNIHTPGELAVRLGVTESLVGQMLDDLAHMGYLRPVAALACHAGPNPDPTAAPPVECALCASHCAVGETGGRLWALTDKAFRLQAE